MNTLAPARAQVVPTLIPYLNQLLAEDFVVTLPQTQGPAAFAVISHPELPGLVYVQQSDFPLLDPTPTLSVPIQRSPRYGSAVLADFCGGPEALGETLRRLLALTQITPRFYRDAELMPVRTEHPYTLQYTPMPEGE